MWYFRAALFSLICMLAPAFVSAAIVSFSSEPQELGMDSIVKVSLVVESDTSINTFAGTFVYPKDFFTIEDVIDGGSIIQLWLKHPSRSEESITFAGFTSDGFTGRGEIFSVLLKAKKIGLAQIAAVDVELLRHDGKGTRESALVKPHVLTIANVAQESYRKPTDNSPPAPFIPQLVRDTEFLDGASYLVFATTDGESGVDHYEVIERRSLFGGADVWKIAESPYRIKDQHLSSDVFVKAIDKSGNEQLGVFPHQRQLRLYEKCIIGSMLVLLVLLWIIFRIYLRAT